MKSKTWKLVCLTVALLSCGIGTQAQEPQHMNVLTNKGLFYQLPLDTILQADGRLIFRNGQQRFDHAADAIDSITFDDIDFQNAVLHIDTYDRLPVTSREDWQDAHFTMDGGTLFPGFETEGRIRGRGNSTWNWYSYGGDPLIYGRRPYKIKFQQKQRVLQMNADRTWVLLANWRDGSFMMNAFANEVGRYLGFAFTPHNRFCEVFINGEYEGLYQLCEQIEVSGHRVDIGEDDVLICLDADDGPNLSPEATDNFWSMTYNLPVCVKYPKDEALTEDVKKTIRDDFGYLEYRIQSHDFKMVQQSLDVRSLIDFLIVQELTCNVELDAPRSMYMYRTSDRIWHFGPLWDFDAGFDFDWSDMYRGHKYFGSQKLLYGNNPLRPNYSSGTKFFLAMFASKDFTQAYKQRWAEVKDALVDSVFTRLDNYRAQLKQAIRRNDDRWPIYHQNNSWWGWGQAERIDPDEEYRSLRQWVERRIPVMDAAIKKYPE